MNETGHGDAGANEPADAAAASLRHAIAAATAPQFEALRRFVDRRIAELSAELHGAVQLVDYSEANLSGQLARIQAQIGSVLAAPRVEARNSGLELEAIVHLTEAAANRIMEAAEAIDDWMKAGGDPAQRAAVTARIGAIFEACSFQDLTGQRVRRVIAHLERVETMLAGILPGDAAPPPGPAPEPAEAGQIHPDPDPAPSLRPDLAQDTVDRLLGA